MYLGHMWQWYTVNRIRTVQEHLYQIKLSPDLSTWSSIVVVPWNTYFTVKVLMFQVSKISEAKKLDCGVEFDLLHSGSI